MIERTPPPGRGEGRRPEAIALLATGVAHAFNNILQTIGAQSEILLSRFDPADPRREVVKEIRKAVHVGGGLTRELLELGRSPDLQERLLGLEDAEGAERTEDADGAKDPKNDPF